MERKREKSFIDVINTGLVESLVAWKKDQYLKEPVLKLDTHLSLVKSAGYGLTVKLNILPPNIKDLPIHHWEEEGLMVFQLDPIKDQTRKGLDPYWVRVFTNGKDFSSFNFCNEKQNGMQCSPYDVDSIEIATQKVFTTLKQFLDEYLPNRLPGSLRGLPQGG